MGGRDRCADSRDIAPRRAPPLLQTHARRPERPRCRGEPPGGAGAAGTEIAGRAQAGPSLREAGMTSALVQAYRLTLWLYPAAFRCRYADEMSVDFEDALHEAVAAGARVALLFVCRTATDTAVSL